MESAALRQEAEADQGLRAHDNYDDRQLERWAERIRQWCAGREPAEAERITDRNPPRRKSRDVYVYFDNDQHAHAPRNARRLAELLSA